MSTHRAALLTVTALALAACERGSSAPPIAPAPDSNTPAFTVVLSTTSISAARGWNAIVNISVARRPDYVEALTFATVGLPSGVSGSFATPILAPTSSATRLDLEVDTLMVPGTYMFSVRATGANATASVTNLAITVPPPSFTLFGLSFLPLTVNGLQATLGFRIGRENSFRGPVTLTLTDIPPGVIGATSYTLLGNEGGITFRAGATAIPGTYKVAVRATGPDVEERTSLLTLLILPAAPAQP